MLEGDCRPLSYDDILEDDIKNQILVNPELVSYLGKLGDTAVVYEKTLPIYSNRVIADALMFTENKGVISFEIKTGHDNLKRLPHQLDAYARCCNYNFVFCEDKQLKGVQEILKHKKYYHVGIITYEEFDHKVIAGLYKQAEPSPYFSLRALAGILWKKELYSILNTYVSRQDLLIANTYGLKKQGSLHDSRFSHRTGNGNVNRSMNKGQLLNIYTKFFDDFQGTKIICETFIQENFSPEKQLVLYKAGRDKKYIPGDIAFKVPFDYHKHRYKK